MSFRTVTVATSLDRVAYRRSSDRCLIYKKENKHFKLGVKSILCLNVVAFIFFHILLLIPEAMFRQDLLIFV